MWKTRIGIVKMWSGLGMTEIYPLIHGTRALICYLHCLSEAYMIVDKGGKEKVGERRSNGG